MKVTVYLNAKDAAALRRQFGATIEGEVRLDAEHGLYHISLPLEHWRVWMLVSVLEVESTLLFEGRTPEGKALLLAALRNLYQ